MSVFDIFAQLDKEKTVSGPPEFLIAGLGNPGAQYEKTRHNSGFRAADYIAEQVNVKINRSKFDALIAECVIGGKKCLLMKPQTFMNSSGTAVGAAADFYSVPADHILILCDDISLNPGKIRIRRDGSAGGHNGLKSIAGWIGSEKYLRIKIGVGAKPNPEYDLADWVLGKMSEADDKLMCGRYPDIYSAVQMMVNGDTEKAMCAYN